MKDHGSATGKVVVEFTIQPDGHVSDSKVGQHSSNPSLDQCIAGNFKHWSFPKPRGGKLWVSAYPITFSVPKEAPKGSLAQDDIVKTIETHLPEHAKVAELADALDSGSSGRNPLGVRPPSFAPA